ncbi:MAG: phosphatidylcholine/phosphatidylserine synthase [Chromatiales bacterium]|nr:phosphatidylcholine/phosphatidylserine synthase [Chromatiales bacterium]
MQEFKGKASKKGIFLLPSVITLASLFSGVYAMTKAYAGNYEAAAIFGLLCVLLDGLDGNIARLTNTVSRFGAELDSLTDAIVFGCIPALIVYQWSFVHINESGWLLAKIGWLSVFFYISATVLRLARFNAQQDTLKKYFRGMPCPAAAALIMSFIWAYEDIGYSGAEAITMSCVILIVSGIAMVSNLSYFSLKQIEVGRVPLVGVLAAISVLIIAALDIPKFLLLISILYLCSGLFLWLTRLFKKRMSYKESPSSDRTR